MRLLAEAAIALISSIVSQPWYLMQLDFASLNLWTLGLALAFSGHLVACLLKLMFTRRKVQKIVMSCRFVGRRRYGPHRRFCTRPIISSHVMTMPKAHQKCTFDAYSQFDIPGGAGGAAATKRKRDEKALLDGLKELINNFGNSSDETHMPTASTDHNVSLLGALKSLICRAESNPKTLLSELRALVNDAEKGAFSDVKEPASSSTAKPAVAKPTEKPTWAQVASKGRIAQPAKNQSFRLWTPPSQSHLIGTVSVVRTDLEAGRIPSCRLLAANYSTALELQALVRSHELDSSVKTAVAILYGEVPPEVASHWVHVQKKGAGPEVKKIPLVPLGSSLPDLPKCQVAKISTLDTADDSVVLRVSIPSCFVDELPNKPANFIQELLKTNGLQHAFVSSYGWRSLDSSASWQDPKPEAITGFLKIAAAYKDNLLKLSGERAVFFEPLAKHRGASVIDWIPQDPTEVDFDYFSRVSAENSHGLTYRRQGRSRLGRRLPEGSSAKVDRVRVWEAKGIPTSWTTGKLVQWLESNKWTDVELVSQATKFRGWLFRGKAHGEALCYAFEYENGKHIGVSQFFHSAKPPKQTPIRSAGRSLDSSKQTMWHSINGPKGVPMKAANLKAADASQSMFVDESKPDGETVDNTTPDGSTPGAKRADVKTANLSPEKKKSKTDNASDASVDKSSTDFRGYEFLDVGGDGDCAFRCAAVSYALQDGRGVSETTSIAKNLGATLRAQVASHLQKYNHFESTFEVDPRWNEKLEGGPVPSSYKEWVQACSRPKRWVDGPGLVTISTRLSRDVVIWKWTNDRWEKQIVIHPLAAHPRSAEQAHAHPPIPLFLKDGHYRTLKPDSAPFPKEWKAQPTGIIWDAGNERGGAKSYKSWLPASSSRSASHRSWLPASSKAPTGASHAAGIQKGWLPASTRSAPSVLSDLADVAKPVKKTQVKTLRFDPKKHTSWTCPKCTTVFEGTHASVTGKKHHHWRTRHSDMPQHLIMRQRSTIIAASADLPEDQRGWSCPLCPAGLPSLSTWDRQNAIKQHIKDCHPEETLQSIYDLRRPKIAKPGVRKHNHEKYARARNKLHKTHDIVAVEPTERNAKGRKRHKGRRFYCKKCLALIGRNPESRKTCAVRQRDFKKNVHTQCMRRRWWLALKKDEPLHAQNYAAAVCKTFQELDSYYGVES